MERKVETATDTSTFIPLGSGKSPSPEFKFSSPVTALLLRDLNSYKQQHPHFFCRYRKHDIAMWLANPYKFERQLREAVRYIYQVSSHFRRIIQYFVGLSDIDYLIEPYGIDPKKVSSNIVNLNYRRTLEMLESMNLKTQLKKVLTVVLREDVFYGYLWETAHAITILQLPSDYCAISEIEENVFNVSFNFSYFTNREELLESFPEEFRIKYDIYKQSGRLLRNRWITLDSPNAFAVKCNADIIEYAIPPFAGVLREVFDIEEFKDLKLERAALENYALVSMTIPLDGEGNWGIDLNKAEEFWRNLDAVLPEEVGSVLTPMPLNKISFERSNASDTKTVTEAEESLFTASGVSSLLFNNAKASSNALLLSIKADQAITYGIVLSITDAINRYLASRPYAKYFRLNILDISPFNRDEMLATYLKACQFGIPMISYYCVASGLDQMAMDSMSFLETTVLNLQERFRPLMSSTQMSSNSTSGSDADSPTDGEAGRPTKGIGEISDSREANIEAEQ